MYQIKKSELQNALLICMLICFASFADGSAQNSNISKNATTAIVPASISLHRDDKMDDSHKQFFAKNPTMLLLNWKREATQLEIYFEKEKIEIYDLSNPADVAKAEKKYGKLPAPAQGSHSL